MAELTDRWQQIIRTPGSTHVVGHHQTEVVDLVTDPTNPTTRQGIRLLCQPIDPWYPGWTIDVTSSAAMAMLEGFLSQGLTLGRRLSFETRGYGARRRDTIRIKPL